MTAQVAIPTGVKLLLAAMTSGAFAFSLLATVVGLQTFDITGSELDLGLLGVAQFLPILVLSPFTGTLADRFDRRRVYGVGLAINIAELRAVDRFTDVRPAPITTLPAGSQPTAVER